MQPPGGHVPVPPFIQSSPAAGTPFSGCLLVSPIPHQSLITPLTADRASHSQAVWQEKFRSICSPQQLCLLIQRLLFTATSPLPTACLPCGASLGLCTSSPGTKQAYSPSERLLEGLGEMELQSKHVLKCCRRNYQSCSASLLRPASLLLERVIISQLVFTRGRRDCDVHRPLNGPALLCRALNHVVLQLSALPFNLTVRASVLLVNRGRWAWLTLLRRQFHQKRGEQRSQMGRKNRLPETEARGIA